MELTAEILRPRLSARIAGSRVIALREKYHQALRQFKGCLPVERESRRAMLEDIAGQIKGAILRTKGREIDLTSLLASGWRNGKPGWALVNPLVKEISGANGRVNVDGVLASFVVGWNDYGTSRIEVHVPSLTESPSGSFEPEPPAMLPQRVRDLARKVVNRTKWVGILYKPEGWKQPKADPALVVEWNAIPGKYFALAVWGADIAQIEEFYKD